MFECLPILLATNFDNPFNLAVDVGDVEASAVLLQEDSDGVDHPVRYFYKSSFSI